MSVIDVEVTIYTDGSCLGNPGPGGYAALIIRADRRTEISGSEPETTNNRMELMGPIKALETLPEAQAAIIYVDSEYVVLGITSRLVKWKANQWRRSDNKPVANRDLWERLDALNRERLIEWKHVAGHSGHIENDHVDLLAKAAAESLSPHREITNLTARRVKDLPNGVQIWTGVPLPMPRKRATIHKGG